MPIPATVLDPFAGSGTVGVVCRKLGRAFVGCEISQDYCEMARKRIAHCIDEKRPDVKDVPGQTELIFDV
jgi:DNA modification methylase